MARWLKEGLSQEVKDTAEAKVRKTVETILDDIKARGDVALSISLTIVSTILAVFFMPLLFFFYTGSSIEIPVCNE